MKNMHALVALVLAVAFANSSADAEPKGQKGKATAASQVHYFDLSSGIFNELGSEAVLKETRQGSTVLSAELEVCHLTAPGSNRLDRFVVPLRVEGNRLVGSAQSQEQKETVSVNLTRRIAGGNFTFEGTVASGSHSEKVRSADNAEITEEEITDQYLSDTSIEAAPTDFTAAWPQSIAVRVRRAGLSGLLDAMRDQNVRVVFNGLITSCRVLRSGHYVVQIDFDAERSGAVLANAKAVPMVTEAGFLPSSPNMQRAVRFPSAGWRDGAGKLDREKFSASVADSMAKAMGATVSSTNWSSMGELVIELKRPDGTVPGLDLAQVVTVTAIISPESPSSNQRSILWIESVAARMVDERPAPRLELSLVQPDDNEEGQSNEPDGSDALPDAVATALKGVRWDVENERWQQ